MKTYLAALAFVLVASSAVGQVIAPTTAYEIQVYRATDSATGTPFRTQQAVATPGLCNLTPTTPPVGTVINPTVLEFDDPGNVGRACRIPFGPFFSSLPVATGYKATVTAINSTGAGPRSNVTGPFDEAPVSPAALTGAGVR